MLSMRATKQKVSKKLLENEEYSVVKVSEVN